LLQMLPFELARLSPQEGGLIGLPLRASNEHSFIVRVARAQKTIRLPSPVTLKLTGGSAIALRQ
jgi:hypothetical protein